MSAVRSLCDLIEPSGDRFEVVIEQVGVDVEGHRRPSVPCIRCTAFTLAPALTASEAAV